MRFHHHPALLRDFPALAVGTLTVTYTGADLSAAVDEYTTIARKRLDGTTESAWPQIQAWRKAFTQMGLKPTQYRCASESLLRRLRLEGTLSAVHPLVDLCNAVSAAHAVPVAALDTDRITGDLEVRYAHGTERYDTFGGTVETPATGEVIYADDAGVAHARRWTNRQSALSAISPATTSVFIVTEALHPGGEADVAAVIGALQSLL